MSIDTTNTFGAYSPNGEPFQHKREVSDPHSFAADISEMLKDCFNCNLQCHDTGAALQFHKSLFIIDKPQIKVNISSFVNVRRS